MEALKTIRQRLNVTQQVFARGIGCSQGNVSHFERGQTIPPDTAKRVIEYCRNFGLRIGFDHIYGTAEIPHVLRKPRRTTNQPKEVPHV